MQLAEHLPAELGESQLADPQIVLQPPDLEPGQEVTSHVDQEPEWAEGPPYLRIVGIPLSSMRATNGGLVVWPPDGGDPAPVEAEPGDVVVMHPAAPHSSGLNREGGIRYVVYFRYLADAPATA